ncbi:Hemicentin-1 [Aphelenchoides avenae]|nr:Hemicentin-1 [Aphelenchus avenae]
MDADGWRRYGTQFERDTLYKFGTGQKVRVKQRSHGLNGSNAVNMDVEFEGDIPDADTDEAISMEAMEEDLVVEKPGKLSGFGHSAMKFGRKKIPFDWEDEITYEDDSSSDRDRQASELVQPGETAHLKGVVKMDDENTMRMAVKLDRHGRCPEGYTKIRDNCKDVNECDLDSEICAEGSVCRNTKGGYECDVSCDVGFKPSWDGECVDVDECRLGMDACGKDKECINTPGSFKCVEMCAQGYFRDPYEACEDVDECKEGPCQSPMLCENLMGGYKCRCPPGFPTVNGTCEGLSMNLERPLQVLPFDTEPDKGHCPSGFSWTGSVCEDVDECAFDAPCQHECKNTAGSYLCDCPDGYAVDDDGKCIDINECEVPDACSDDELCFNGLGDYSCITRPCPSGYRIDSSR